MGKWGIVASCWVEVWFCSSLRFKYREGKWVWMPQWQKGGACQIFSTWHHHSGLRLGNQSPAWPHVKDGQDRNLCDIRKDGNEADAITLGRHCWWDTCWFQAPSANSGPSPLQSAGCRAHRAWLSQTSSFTHPALGNFPQALIPQLHKHFCLSLLETLNTSVPGL